MVKKRKLPDISWIEKVPYWPFILVTVCLWIYIFGRVLSR